MELFLKRPYQIKKLQNCKGFDPNPPEYAADACLMMDKNVETIKQEHVKEGIWR